MNKAATLVMHNLKKAKGQFLSFGLIICLTALIMNLSLVLAFQTFNAYDARFSGLNTADINFLIPRIQDHSGLMAEIEKIDGVDAVEKHDGVFLSVTVREFADSDFDMNTVFYNLDEERTLNLLDVSESQGISGNTVYIPMYMKALGGFTAGGSISYSIDGEDFTYDIGGIVSEMQYGNYGTGLIGAYFPAAVYASFEEKHSEQAITEYSLKTADGAGLTQIKNAVTNLLSDQGINALNINDRIASKQTRTMVCTLLIIIFLALAAIILAVSIFLNCFRIRSTVEDELAGMGVLKAIGYTSSMIIYSVVAPYTLVSIVFALIGTALSYTVLPSLAQLLAIQSGFTYTPVFDAGALLLVILIPAFTTLLFAYLSAMKIYKLEPINAIRGCAENKNTKQGILLSALSIGIMVLLSFAGTLLYNVSIKPDHFMNTISEETPSVIFTVQNDKMSEFKETLQNDSRVKLVLEYASAPVSYADGSMTAFVCEDFTKATNNICYEGRSPVSANEIAVGNALADSYPIGGEIEISVSGQPAVYLVTGYIQSVNLAGKVCQLTNEGYEKIGEKMNTLNVYLHDKIAEELIAEYENSHDTPIISSVNYEQLSENGQSLYAGIVSAVIVVLFLISVLMALLVLYIIINSMISRRRQEFGIYKAIGYTSRQLIIMTVTRFMPVVALSSVLSAAAGIWYLPAVNRTILSQIGAFQNYFEIPVLILLVTAVIFTAMSFVISVLLAAPIKKITVYSLLKD